MIGLVVVAKPLIDVLIDFTSTGGRPDMKIDTALHRHSSPASLRSSLRILPFALLFILGSALSQTDNDRPQPVTLAGTETLNFTSSVNGGQEYSLLVHLPQGYTNSSDRYPVIYVLDAQWDFPLVTSIYGQQYYDGFIPSAVIVGITWGGKDPKHDSLRARDLTPFHDSPIPQSGKAETFLNVIRTEIFPLIETRYRAQSNGRTLMGSSFGGLFTLFALFQESPLFERFVMTSPAIGWARDAIIGFEDDFADGAKSLQARLFMAQGELEGGMENFKKFTETIDSRRYAGLQMLTRVVEGAGHSGGKAEGYTRGLQWVFAWPSVSVDPKVLDRYEGEYEVAPDMRAKIWRSENVLMAALPGGPTIPFRAKSETEFYARGFFLRVHFVSDDQGVVTELVAEEYSRTTHAKKVR